MEHAIGYAGYVQNHIHFIPGTTSNASADLYVHAAGGSLVVSDLNDPHNQSFFQGHVGGDVTCLAVSPASKRLGASGQSGTDSDVVVWDFVKKKMIYRFEEHDYGIQSLAFSHDERLLVSLGIERDRKLIVWDLATGGIVTSMRNASFRDIKFGGMVKNVKRRDTQHYQLAAVGDSGAASLFDLDPFEGTLTEMKLNAGSTRRSYTALEFSKDREYLYAGSTSGDISIFLVKSQSLVASVPVCQNGVCSIARVPDGDALYVGGGDGHLSLWTVSVDYYGKISIQKVRESRVDGQITSIGLRRRRKRIGDTKREENEMDDVDVAVGTAKGYVMKRTSSSSSSSSSSSPTDAVGRLRCVSENHCDSVTDVAYAANVSDRFATCSRDRTVRIWDASDYTVRNKAFVRGAGSPTSVCLSSDHIFTGWDDGQIRCHGTFDGSDLWTISEAHKVVNDRAVRCMQLSNNEKFLLSGGEDGAIRVWEIRRRLMVTHLKEHKSRISHLALFSDDTHAISCSQDRSFLCWDLQAERRISTHTQRTGGINSLALSCDQTVVITCGKERSITFWDLRDPDPVRAIYPAHDGEGTSIAVMRSNQHIFATAGSDACVKIWDMRTCREPVAEGLGHSGAINQCMFSPDDKQLVSVGEDGCVFVWNFYAPYE